MAVNKFFNADYYLAKNPDLIRAGLNTSDGGEMLWTHYELYGAQESTVNSARGPNPWFEVNYYLAANPDLNAAGLTAADALNHYATYGVFEGREFSATVSASQFNAETYVEENKDVAAAFGIEAGAELTAENKADLLSHYLAYGYGEGRKGAGKIADTVQADNVINVAFPADASTVGGYPQQGTIMNDKFIVDGDAANGAAAKHNVLDGLGGNDTVVFNAAATTNAAANNVTLRNIENVVVNNPLAVTFTSEQAINKITLGKDAAAVVTANIAANAVAGSADVLNVVNNSATLGNLVTNGYETVNVDLGKSTTEMATLTVSKTQGDTFTVNLKGGAATGFDLKALENASSGHVKNFVLDGSGLTGGLTTGTFGQLNGVENVTIKGSATAGNTFTAFNAANDVKQNVTLIGGQEADVLVTSAAIDTLTGGAGNDTFTLTSGNSLVASKKVKDADGIESTVITGVDQITDFKAGDLLKTAAFTKLTVATGEAANLKTLEDWVTKATDNQAFDFGGSAYIVLKADAGTDAASFVGTSVEVVELAGVSVDKFFNADGTMKGDATDGFSFV